ncbi:hypothetical protein AB1A65_15835 [Muricauda sp. ANG21]|uniref:hypothetical protein n=1 Tax=Allomuricauda sp. ANG21 TaxID=3042468 RepID=UPI003452137A
MRIKEIILASLLISSCGGTKNFTILPELTLENQQANKLIVDRKPDYGINGRDGCVIMGEISMIITELENRKSVRGKVFDSEKKEPLINAKLKLTIEQNGSERTSEIYSDANGIYNTDLFGELKKMEVEYIAYRTLKIDFAKQ